MPVRISRSAEALAAVVALSALIGGLLLRALAGDNAGPGRRRRRAHRGRDRARALRPRRRRWAAREKPGAVGLCLVVGSPAVLGHATLGRSDGPLAPEAGALAALALPVVLIVLVWAISAR